ncbi:phospholipase D-like domain-containing protein [Elusimicrobiota bacterium]
MNKFVRVFSILAMALALGTSVRAGFNVPGFELAATIPVETELSYEGVRPAHEVLTEMFASAQKSIDLSSRFCTPKEGTPIEKAFEELRKAGERGVHVRVLVDKKFKSRSRECLKLIKTFPNVEAELFDFREVKYNGILNARYVVVDEKTAYLGSQNFDWRSHKHIHELGLKITEAKIASALTAIFEHDWKARQIVDSGKKPKSLRSNRPKPAIKDKAYVVASPYDLNPKGVGDSVTELVRLIGTAQKDLKIQVQDYTPLTRKHEFYPPIDNALREACARGVKIELLVSEWNTDKPYVSFLKSLHLVPNIEIRVADIPDGSEGHIRYGRVIHSKIMVVDGKTLWLGTGDWGLGHLEDSRNVEIVVKDEVLAVKVQEMYAALWNSIYSKPIDVQKEYPKPVRATRWKFESPFKSTVKGLNIPNSTQLRTDPGARIIRGMAPRNEEDILDLLKIGMDEILIFKEASRDEVDSEYGQLTSRGFPAGRIHHIPFRWRHVKSFKVACTQTVDALKIMRDAERAGRTLFFHCTVGEDRTGYLAGIYSLLKDGKDARSVFKTEMCENGYGSGNPKKPVERVVVPIRKELTPIYLSMAYYVKQGALSLDKLDASVCTAEPSSEKVSAMFDAKVFQCEASSRYKK